MTGGWNGCTDRLLFLHGHLGVPVPCLHQIFQQCIENCALYTVKMLMSSPRCRSKRNFSPNYLVSHNALSIPSPAAFREVIDSGELDQGGEDKGVADSDEPVHGSGVGYLGKGVPCTYTQCGHSEDGGNTWKQTISYEHLFVSVHLWFIRKHLLSIKHL